MSTTSNSTRTVSSRRAPIQVVSLVVGIVFLAVGILGFIPGITTHSDDLMFAGHSSMGKLLGVFQVSVLHNIVHLLFGVVGIFAARHFRSAKAFLIVGGIIYLVLWIYGLIIDPMSGANFVPLNTPDNWLHFFLGVGMIALGLIFGRSVNHDSDARL